MYRQILVPIHLCIEHLLQVLDVWERFRCEYCYQGIGTKKLFARWVKCGILVAEKMLGGQIMVKDSTSSMKNAEASIRTEGYTVTDKMREHCRWALDREATTAEVLRQFDVSGNGAKLIGVQP